MRPVRPRPSRLPERAHRRNWPPGERLHGGLRAASGWSTPAGRPLHGELRDRVQPVRPARPRVLDLPGRDCRRHRAPRHRLCDWVHLHSGDGCTQPCNRRGLRLLGQLRVRVRSLRPTRPRLHRLHCRALDRQRAPRHCLCDWVHPHCRDGRSRRRPHSICTSIQRHRGVLVWVRGRVHQLRPVRARRRSMPGRDRRWHRAACKLLRGRLRAQRKRGPPAPRRELAAVLHGMLK